MIDVWRYSGNWKRLFSPLNTLTEELACKHYACMAEHIHFSLYAFIDPRTKN